MIPKTIHYCWFGYSEKPESVKSYIESWVKNCPDYQIIEWNEDNFDFTQNRYCQQAYDAKKWAFVSDYARLWILYHNGGIYMDTDVEVVQPLGCFLSEKGFSGFESPKHVSTSIMAAEKGLDFIGKLLYEYDRRSFLKPNGEYDMSTNVTTITAAAVNNGLILNGEKQTIKEITYYPLDYFCPFDDLTGKLVRTKNTHTIHWYSKSWMDPKLVKRSKITKIFHRIFGINCFELLKRIMSE